MPCAAHSIIKLPNELLHEIADHIALTSTKERIGANKTLRSLALVGRRYVKPAQTAMLRRLVLTDSSRIDRITRLLLKRKHLGGAVDTLVISIGWSDEESAKRLTSVKHRALELGLLGLLPLTKNVRDVQLAATHDCPSNLIDLLTGLLRNVRSFSLTSAYGYSKLVYVGTSNLAKILSSWTRLQHLSLTMPWLFDDLPHRRRPALKSQLRSLEISGFRGEMAHLEWLLDCVGDDLTRFAFDCPLDNEHWHDLVPALAKLKDTLTELSLWSWTYRMPIEATIRSCTHLRHLSLAAHDCSPGLFQHLPTSLSSLLICSHRDFSPLNARLIASGLETEVHLKSLSKLTLYDPSAHGKRFEKVSADKAWIDAGHRGTEVSLTTDPRILGCHIHLPDHA